MNGPATTPTRVMGRRVLAWLLDMSLLSAAAFAVFFAIADRVPAATVSGSAATATVTLGRDEYLLEGGRAGLFMTLTVAGWLLVTGVLPGLTGWTPGKRVTGVRVAGGDGRPPGVGRGIVRQLCWIVDGFPYFLPGLVGFCLALATPRRQRLGDQLANTLVVRAGTRPDAEERPLAAGASPGSPSAGWYADPRGEQRLRYWDGDGWTAHTAP